jgi:hypothetical protein
MKAHEDGGEDAWASATLLEGMANQEVHRAE